MLSRLRSLLLAAVAASALTGACGDGAPSNSEINSALDDVSTAMKDRVDECQLDYTWNFDPCTFDSQTDLDDVKDCAEAMENATCQTLRDWPETGQPPTKCNVLRRICVISFS